jgi:hypothetical protein
MKAACCTGVFQQRVLLRFDKRLDGDPLHRVALPRIEVHGLVELLGLGARRRDRVDGPQDLRAQLVLWEVVEVLDQHARRGGGADGREGLHRGDALRFPAPLDDLVQMGNRNLIAE